MSDPLGGARATPRGLARALGLAWQSGPFLVVGYGLLTLVEALLAPAVAWLTKLGLDAVTGRAAEQSLLVRIGVALAVVGAASALLPHASGYLQSEQRRRVGLVSRERLFTATERFVGLARFENPQFLDRLSLAQQSGGLATGAVVSGAFTIGSGLVTVLGFMASLLVITPWLTVAVTAAALPALLAEWRLSRHRSAMMWRLSPVERRELFFQQLLTSVQAAKELRLFRAGQHFRRRMMLERRTANAEERRMDRRDLLTQSGLGLLSAVVAGGSLLWALLQAWHGRITPGDVALLVAAIASVQSGMAGLVRDVMESHQQLAMFDHFLAVVDSETDLPVRRPAIAAPPLRKGIEVRDVWFRYSPDHPWTLRGVSFTIRHGESVGLVGRNGAGKSTLVKLLCRMYDPERGSIRWDGIDIRDLDPDQLRCRIGAVFQDYMTYDLTATENIALGELDQRLDRGEIEQAARRAGIHDTLAGLPQGYQTMLTRMFADPAEAGTHDPEAGVVLSGGQWQRLAIARGLLRAGRDLLILDEPSSGLDAEAEYQIHTTLRRHRAGHTSLLISHRLGAIRDADVLVVLERGQVVERGAHAALVSAGGVYAQLFSMQAAGYQAKPSPMAVT